MKKSFKVIGLSLCLIGALSSGQILFAQADTVSSATPNSQTKPKVQKDYLEIGMQWMEKEKAYLFKKGQSAAQVEKALGKPEAKSKVELWGADGLEHQTWTYKKKGLMIGFSKEKGESQKVFSVQLTSPSKLKTSKGIGLGSDKKAILKAYASLIEAPDQDPETIIVGSAYGGIVFNLKKDKVTSIFIGAVAE